MPINAKYMVLVRNFTPDIKYTPDDSLEAKRSHYIVVYVLSHVKTNNKSRIPISR